MSMSFSPWREWMQHHPLIFSILQEAGNSIHQDLHLSQTKIRGIRVEVQEIEHKIREVYSPSVGIVVEVRHPNFIPGQQMLVAFIETENDNIGIDYDSRKEIQLEELKSSIDPSFSEAMQQVDVKLRKVLPDYMIPSLYIPVKSLPFANAYKLDRKALKETVNQLEESDIQDIAKREKQVE